MGESDVPLAPDIVPPEGDAPLLAIGRDLPVPDAASAIRLIEQRVQFFRDIREKTVALTYSQDWVDFNGKPYLQATGVERLIGLWGIYIREIRMEPTLEETRRRLRAGEHVTVECRAIAGSRHTGERSEFMGGRSSDDPWFAERTGGIQTLDPEDLRKAAYSNLEVNVVMRLLGLRNLTWADLASYGLRKESAGGAATFKQSGGTDAQAKRKALAEDIRLGLLALHGDTPAALDALFKLSHFQDNTGKDVGLRTWADLANASERWLLKISEKLQKLPVKTSP
jgi:hypothetical protein